MSTQRHMIKKQILELQLRSRERAFQIQNEVSRIYRDNVVPLIEACCNEFSDPNVIHRIEMLELDLGTIALENLEDAFPEHVERQLRQRLAEQIRVAEVSSPSSSSTPPKTSQPAAQADLLSYFLHTGTLPWWAGTLRKEDLEKRVDQLIASSPDAIKTLLAESVRHERSLKRLISQFSDAILLKTITVFSPELSQFVGDYLKDIEAIFTRTAVFEGIPREKFRLEHWRGILVNLLFPGRATPNRLWLTRDTLVHLAASFRMPYVSLVHTLTQAVQQLKKAGVRFKSELPDLLSASDQDLQPVQSADLSNTLKVSDDLFSDSEEMYISNAGLILLWPFLKRFFETIGLVGENNFINAKATERGALVLQYMTDGATDIPEHILPLNKILCGMDVSDVVEMNSLAITEPEQIACENLLSAVIHHWTALKNTSVSGFQRIFLQREGVLSVRDGGWLLRVERQTHDVLLEKLPWGIGIVKLPWMEVILAVEW